MTKIIYSKYSNERSECFAVRTDIIERDGKKNVIKTPVSEASRSHVEGMYEIFQELRTICGFSGYEVLSCKKEGDSVCFPYVQGDTLEEIWDSLLTDGCVFQVEEELISYCDQVRKMFSDAAFHMTDSFCDIFGIETLPDGMMAREVSNIDMLAGNVICSGEKKYLIDYEWTFFFPVPADFIVYRILHYYLYANDLRAVLRERDLFSRCGIPVSCMDSFGIMEKNFQNYITGEKVPLRDLYPAVSPGVFPAEIRARQESENRKNSVLQLFYSYGSGYLEEDSMYFSMKDYHIQLEQELPPGVTNIRLDPGASGTLCKVKRLCFDTSASEVEEYHSFGYMLQDNWIVFDRADPQITLDSVPEKAERLFVDISIVPMEEEVLRIWGENCSCSRTLLEQCAGERNVYRERAVLLENENQVLENEKLDLKEQKRNLENEVRSLKEQITNMRSTKVWRAWEKMKKFTGRGTENETD